MDRIPRIYLAAAAALAIAGGLGAWSCVLRYRDTTAAASAGEPHTEYAAQAAKGAVYDAQEKQQGAQVQADSGRVRDAGLAVKAAEEALAQAERTPPGPDSAAPSVGGVDGPGPVPPPVAVASVEAAKDGLILALRTENGALHALVNSQGAQILTLTLARDSWHSAADNLAQENVQIRASLAAKDGLIEAAKIEYGLGGFLVGFGAGRIKP